MNIINLIRTAVKALRRNKLRTFLTMLGIIIGVASVISMVAIGQGSKASIQERISSMGTNMIIIHPGTEMHGGARHDASNTQTLTLNDADALIKSPYIKAISPSVSGRGQVIYGSANWPTSIQGVSPDFLDIRKMSLKEGVMFSAQEVHNASKVCVLGATVVDKVFPNENNPVGKVIRFNKIPFKVIGVLASKGESTFGQDQDDLVLSPYTTVQKRILAITYINMILASAINEDSTEQAAKEIEEIIRAKHKLGPDKDNDFSVRTQKELLSAFSSTSEVLTALLAIIAGISLIVGGIGIMNIMYVSVTERTREIGLRMAVGARGVDILLQFLIEAVMISLTGGFIGISLGIGASFSVTKFLRWPTLITPSSIVLSFIVCVATGIFFGWYPAQKASQLDPIEALRYE